MIKTKTILVIACALCLGAIAPVLSSTSISAAPRSPSTEYNIPWWTVDNGGGTSQGGDFIVQGSIGQADAGVLSGGIYTLSGGFWSKADNFTAFLPLIRR